MFRTFVAETTKKIGKEVLLKGWVHRRRDMGKLIFIDLRDKSGIIQVVFMSANKKLLAKADQLRPEWVISIKGIVNQRPAAQIKKNDPLGVVEILAREVEIVNQAATLPFEITDDGRKINEELRLKYRYLDLRRERMKNNLILRDKVIDFIRQFLHKHDFVEIETPILTKSTPEGARDHVVPSRLQPGKFYALPQSPQQYKQLLMVAGIERYFQFPRCFRDEDTRGDRQPEFTQLDIEMSFVEQDDILDLIEEIFTKLVKTLFPEKKLKTPFPRLTYKEVMEKYKTDKPDLRENKDDPDELAFCFVIDFPMFEWKKEEKRWDAVHHPFTKIQNLEFKIQNLEFIDYIKKNPDKLLAYQYDFVCNGFEVGGGSIREHNPQILQTVFEIMGHTPDEVKTKFGHLLEAFKYGVPPHGGIAAGIDRLVMIFSHGSSIREVIAFPKTGDGRDLMMNAPAGISEKQLKELNLKIN